MRKVAFIDFHGTIAYKSYSETLHQVLMEFDPNSYHTQSTFRDLLDGSYLWDNPDVAHLQYNRTEAWWGYMEGKIKNAFIELGYKKEADLMTRRFRNLYTSAKEYMIYDDALEGLKRIRQQGWLIVVLSNHMPELKNVVRNTPLSRYIREVISSAKVGYEKPNRKIYEYAIRRMLFPYKKVMIGDSIIADVQGATEAGIPAILVRNSLFKDNENCKYFAKDMIEAAEVLKENF